MRPLRSSSCAAILSLLLGMTACTTDTKKRDQDDERAESPATEKREKPSGQPSPAVAPINWTTVGEALGKAGAVQPGDVYKVGMPRGDLHVTVGSVQVKPALALGSWVGFKQTGENKVMAMGDLVLLDSEVGPVLTKLREGGIEQTAIHNHLQHE